MREAKDLSSNQFGGNSYLCICAFAHLCGPCTNKTTKKQQIHRRHHLMGTVPQWSLVHLCNYVWANKITAMWQASCKCETPGLELKSSQTFLAIKRCEGTKLEKLLSNHEAQFISWCIIYAPLVVKLLNNVLLNREITHTDNPSGIAKKARKIKF